MKIPDLGLFRKPAYPILLFLLWCLPFSLVPSVVWAEPSAESWQSLQRGGVIAIMRHALAPGMGDPAIFNPEDCTTQRNLSDTGRAQAHQIGQTLRDNGISSADVYSSVWCRCIDTAQLLNLGAVEKMPALNSFFEDRSTAESQTEQTRQWIEARLAGKRNGPVILVTHQVNISALTGQGTSSGEMLFITLDGGDIRVVDRLLIAP